MLRLDRSWREHAQTVPVFEREARVKFSVTFEWYYCEREIRECDKRVRIMGYVSDTSEYSE